MHIYIHSVFQETERNLLRSHLATKYQLSFGNELPEEQRKSTFLQADICLGNVPLDWATETTSLQWLQLHSAGIDPYNKIENHRFPISNLKGFFGQSVAETTLAGILAVYRGIDKLAVWQQEKHWIGTPLRSSLHLLQHAKVLILGAGAIGLSIQKLLTGFDCDTKVFARKEGEYNLSMDDLSKYLPTADILIACLPETPQTLGLINEALLSQLPSQALFVNVGRGSAVDELALIDLLNKQAISGAVLDVTLEEPLPKEKPLWEMPNVLLTQHTSGGWAEESRDKVLFFLRNLTRFEHEEPLINVVDWEKGY